MRLGGIKKQRPKRDARCARAVSPRRQCRYSWRGNVETTHRTLDLGSIRMHIAEAGSGPLVLLCHGFPELWYSWRHQLSALSAAGSRAVRPDMRGFGQTSAPADVAAYTIFHNVGDMVALTAA